MEIKATKKSSFILGPIPADFIGNSIAKHQSKTSIGAHTIFLGQVRADEIDGKKVTAIDYTAYEEMAEKSFHGIREAAFDKFELSCLHIYHSLGLVKSGEICLFVFVSAPRRRLRPTDHLAHDPFLRVPPARLEPRPGARARRRAEHALARLLPGGPCHRGGARCH